VLNDWPDEPTVAILRRCAEAASGGGRIVVLGGVSPDAAPRPLAIDMLVAGGKTSTLTQFRELARRAGLDVVAAFYAAVFGRDVRSHAPDVEAPGLIGQWITDRTAVRDAGPLLWIYVTDMTEALRLARARGGTVVMPPAADGPVRTLATITDPDGNLIGLAAYTPRL
jgi:predicted enzyme related to lactoylglutathione lyase